MSKSALELVVQLRTLASDPNNRAHMIPTGDYVPPGLVMFLDHPSSDVVYNALETVYFLSLYPPNRALMIKNEFLMPKLKLLMSNGKTGEIKRKAIATFTSLKKASTATMRGAPTAADLESFENAPSTSNIPTSTTDSSKDPLGNNNAANKRVNKGMPTFGFDGSSSRASALTITVYMKELGSEARKTEFESKMVNHRGVVSFWVDLNQNKAVVRTSLTEDALVKAIMAQLGWIASTDATFVSPSNAGYMEEEEIGAGAIVHRAKQTKKAKETQSTGWFGGVTSYLWG